MPSRLCRHRKFKIAGCPLTATLRCTVPPRPLAFRRRRPCACYAGCNLPEYCLPPFSQTLPSPPPTSSFSVLLCSGFASCSLPAARRELLIQESLKASPSWLQPWSHNRGWTIRSPGRHLWPLGRTSALPLEESVALSSTCLRRHDACPSEQRWGDACWPLEGRGGHGYALSCHTSQGRPLDCAQQASRGFCPLDRLRCSVPSSSSWSGHVHLGDPPD